MRRASIAALKARLSEYLAAVKAGEEIIVTDRGRPVARLGPLGSQNGAQQARVEELVRAGLARPPERRLSRRFWRLPRPADREGRSLELIKEERETGW